MKDAAAMAELNVASTAVRQVRAAYRTALADGSITLEDVMDERPAALHDVMLVDLILWTRSRSRGRRSPAITAIGRMAVAADVNLLLTLGVAGLRSRAWVAANGYRSWRPNSAALIAGDLDPAARR